MDDVVNRFARELADAIAAAVAENPQVEACREKARAAGFEMKVTLEAVVGFVSRSQSAALTKVTAPARVVQPKRNLEVTANDRRFLRSLRITSMDFLLPDVSHDSKERIYGGLGPTPVADYLLPVLDAWLEEDNADVSVRIFKGLFRRLLGSHGLTDDFGNTGSSYLIVETDGSIEANDALRVCENGIARSGLNVLRHGFDDLAMAPSVVYRAVNGGFPLPTGCRACPEQDLCGGGYLPHRYSKNNGFDNPSVWCADILRLLSHMRQQLGAEGLATVPVHSN